EPRAPPPPQPVADDYQPAAYAYQPVGVHETSAADRAARDQQDEPTPPTGWAAPPPPPPGGGAGLQSEVRWTPRGPTTEANAWAAPANAEERYESQSPRRAH